MLQIVLAASETEYFHELISAIKNAEVGGGGQHLLQSLGLYSIDRESEIESICSLYQQGFVSSVNQLQEVRDGSFTLMTDVLGLNNSIQSSIEALSQQKKALVDCRAVRQKINDADQALHNCLEVLRLANQVYDLLGKKVYYSALRALDELQNVHLLEVTQYRISDLIQKSVPATKKLVGDAVMADLNTWLFRIRETSQFLGEVSFYHTEQRRTRHKDRSEKIVPSTSFMLNSAVELVADEDEEFDILDNEDVQVDFTPLFECMHIHDALGQMESFKVDYAFTRRQQKELLMPASITLIDLDGASLSELLEGIAGFALIEKATMKKAPNLRSMVEVCNDLTAAIQAFADGSID